MEQQKQTTAKGFLDRMEQLTPEEVDQELSRLMSSYGIQAKPHTGTVTRLAWPVDKPLGIAYG